MSSGRMTSRPLVYTDVETHRASLRERVQVVRLMWRVANDLPAKKRRKIKRATITEYLRPGARVTYYLASGGFLDGARRG